MEELISIIIPVYNVADFVPRCLETVIAQSYSNLEIIVVDDGSTDNSGFICDDFARRDPRIKVIHKKNEGLSEARNTGLREIHGDYVMFIDSDDYVHRDFVKTLHTIIQQDGGYEMAECSYKATNQMDEDTESPVNDKETRVLREDFYFAMLMNGDRDWESGVVWNKLYRRSLIEGEEFKKYEISEDMEYMFRVYLKLDKVIYTPAKLYYYVQRSTSVVHTPDIWSTFYWSRTKMDYDLLMSLRDRGTHKAHYLLRDLYLRLAELKYMMRKTDRYEEACQRCREYIKVTRKDYIFNRNIRLIEKVIVMIMMHFPITVKWVTEYRRRFRPQPEKIETI